MPKTKKRPRAIVRPVAAAASSSAHAPRPWEQRFYLALLSIAPLLIYAVNQNWTFQGLGHMDNWYYAGMFHVPLDYEPDMHNYALERLSWNIPGHVLSLIFPAPLGGMILNFLCHAAGLVLLFQILRRLAGDRTAFLTAVLMAMHPLYIGANGWNYLNGASNVYLLLAYWALAAGHAASKPWRYWLLAGVSWSCLINGYIAWLVFTPTCLLLWMAGDGRPLREQLSRDGFRRLLRVTGWFSMGFAAMFALFAALFRVLVPNAMHPFFWYNVTTALNLGTASSNPWSRGNFSWLPEATWIVTPIAATLFAVGFLAFRRPILNSAARYILAAFLYSFGIMIVFTLRQNRLLEFDYFASILLPAAYLALGVTAFRVPMTARPSTLLGISAVGAALMSIGLLVPDAHYRLLQRGILIPLLIPASAALLALFWRARAAWAAVALLFAFGTYPLVPAYPARAYREKFDGFSAYARVAEAVDVIYARHRADGRNQAALLWLNNNDDPYTPEFRAIMCGFMAHKISMWDYPKVDLPRLRRLRPGDLFTVLSSTQHMSPQAAANLAATGFVMEPAGQTRIARGGGSYWVTFFRVRATKS